LSTPPSSPTVGARERGRFFLAAFGQPGHAFPMLALGKRLVERGHTVVYETWSRWREDVEAAGMEFVAAPEYPVFPTRERPLKPYEAVVLACAETRPAIARSAPDVVVHDILTLAPALAAELEGIAAATLIPHLYPVGIPGYPPYAFGARAPRTPLSREVWRALERPVETGLRQGRAELNDARAKLGLPPVERLHGGLSERLCLVGTLPQLEYPRDWPGHVHVVGPLMWEPPFHDVDPPPGQASGRPVLAVPHVGDMAENAARADWAGVGLRLPWRFVTPTGIRLAVRRALGSESLGLRAGQLAAWAAAHDGATRAAELLEELALSPRGEGARTGSARALRP
jgi:UDP:flavonoid glycosyltransferase YjiC (YdhE family)